MIIGGLQKTTLIDYPGKIACTVFMVGCNFRCPFCYNRDLVTLELFKKRALKLIPEKDFFAFLKSRKNWLEGVCLTGGEPSLQPDLLEFCAKIKKLGFEVKLDTNGSQPQMLERLLKKKLVDYVAMDIKSPFEDYLQMVKIKNQSASWRTKCNPPAGGQNEKLINKIKKTIRLLLKSGVDFELRTTVVAGLHNEEVLLRMARQVRRELSGVGKVSKASKVSKVRWYLQQFRPKNCLDPAFEEIKPYSEKKLLAWAKKMRGIMPGVKERGA